MLRLFQIAKKEDGFTIAEFIIYGAIIVALIGGMYTIYEGSEEIYSSASGQAIAQRDGRIAQKSLTKYLRMVESFIEANDYDIKFRADVDDDTQWDEVNYYIDSNNLYIKVNNGSAEKLASGVRNEEQNQPLFLYYDNHGSAITTDTASRITKTYQMGVQLVIDTDLEEQPEAYTLSSRITLRNTE